MRPATDLHGYCCSVQQLLSFKFCCKFYCKFYFTCDRSFTDHHDDWLVAAAAVGRISQSVDSQTTTDNETGGKAGPTSEQQKDIQRLLDNQQQIFQILQQHQTILNRLCEFFIAIATFLTLGRI